MELLIFLLLAVFWFSVFCVYDLVLRKKRICRLAWKFLDEQDRFYIDKHEYREVAAGDFDYLDLE